MKFTTTRHNRKSLTLQRTFRALCGPKNPNMILMSLCLMSLSAGSGDWWDKLVDNASWMLSWWLWTTALKSVIKSSPICVDCKTIIKSLLINVSFSLNWTSPSQSQHAKTDITHKLANNYCGPYFQLSCISFRTNMLALWIMHTAHEVYLAIVLFLRTNCSNSEPLKFDHQC